MKNLIKKKIPELTTTIVISVAAITLAAQDFTPSPSVEKLRLHNKNVKLEKKYKEKLYEKRKVEKTYKEYKWLADRNYCQIEYQENQTKRDKLVTDFKTQNPNKKFTETLLIELVDKGIKLYPKSERCKNVSIRSNEKKPMDELQKRYEGFQKNYEIWGKKLNEKNEELQKIKKTRDKALNDFVKFKRGEK